MATDPLKAIPPAPPVVIPVTTGSDGGFSTPIWQSWFARLAAAINGNATAVTANVVATLPPGIKPVHSLPVAGDYDGQTVYLDTAGGGNAVGLYTWNLGLGIWLSAVNPNSTYVLKGITSVTNTGGIVAGTVTWNPSTGVVTGGSGVVLTKNGIAGVNSGSTTFSIDTLGNAQFAGTLVGAIVTAGNINVANLAAINANLGMVTAGTLQGTLIETATSGQRITLNDASNTNAIAIYNSAGIQIASIGSNASGFNTAYGFFTTADSITNALSAQSTGSAPAFEVLAGASGAGISVVGGSTGAGISVGATGTGVGIQVLGNSSASAVTIMNHGNTALTIDGGINMTAGGGALFSTNILPLATNTYVLGSATAAWSGIWSQTAVVVTSDRRKKKSIKLSDLGLDFIGKLIPRSYLVHEGKRRHYGFIAQEVKEALGDKDAAFWILADKDDPESTQSLRNEELIAPLVKAVQELCAELAVTKASISRLKDRVTYLGG